MSFRCIETNCYPDLPMFGFKNSKRENQLEFLLWSIKRGHKEISMCAVTSVGAFTIVRKQILVVNWEKGIQETFDYIIHAIVP